ncbi:MAG: hypothetical protein GY715_17785 [Planctomycetes bacterium]|nr:hypothetical protein [Planctomycetota bacterium]
MNLTRRFRPATAVAVALLALPAAPTLAQEEPASAPDSALAPASDSASAPDSPLSLDIGVDWVTTYFYHGLFQEDDGTIIQPWVEAGLVLAETESLTLSGRLGVWTSFHSAATGASTTSDTMEHFYEADLYAGIGIESGPWSMTADYHFDTSPSDAFDVIEELIIGVSLDDSDLWNGPTLRPSVTLAVETGSVANDSGDTGAYLELGIAPGFEWPISPDDAIDISIPVSVGLSLDNYFEDASGNSDTFGFLDVGIIASLESEPSQSAGTWTIHGGVHFMFLGDSTQVIANDDDFWVIGTAGVSVSF